MKASLKPGLSHRFAYQVPESAHDGVDLIGEGRHERFVVAWDKFNARVAEKTRTAGLA